MTMRTRNGGVMQSGLVSNPTDYENQRMNWPIIGVVLAVHFSDDPQNPSAIPVSDQRGTYTTCDVLVMAQGNDNPMIIPNVVVLPSGASGVDDFSEEIPRACSLMIDGSKFDSRMASIDYHKLDGDWCVVQFIGGSIEQPFMVGWWPHPGNHIDSATAGFPVQHGSTGPQDAQTLKQGRRLFRRYRGLKFTITDKGSFFVDTNQSNEKFQGSQSGVERKKQDEGGDIQVDIKPERQFQANFNAPVPLPNTEPSLSQPNPPEGEKQRKTDRTTFTMTKDLIRLLAGQICEILTSDDYIDMHAKTKVRMRGDDGNDSVLLGDTDPTNMDHAIKGETYRDLFNGFIDWAVTHTHKTSVGPTDVPTQTFTQRMNNTHLSLPVMVKK